MKSTERITIGWIDSGTIYTGFAAHLSTILLNRSEIINNVAVSSGPYLSLNRNRMAQLFLDSGADWLLSLDSDVCVPIDSFDKIVEAADAELRPVMGGIYYIPFEDGRNIVIGAQKFTNPEDPYALGDWLTPQEVVNAKTSGTPIIENLHSTGIGFTLIHREVFLAIKALNPTETFPWFKDAYSEEYRTWTSDDIHFWTQCRILGIKISTHLEATTDHLKQFKLNNDVYMTANPDVQRYEPTTSYIRPSQRTSWWTKSKRKK